jgi:hypothetical protein
MHLRIVSCGEDMFLELTYYSNVTEKAVGRLSYTLFSWYKIHDMGFVLQLEHVRDITTPRQEVMTEVGQLYYVINIFVNDHACDPDGNLWAFSFQPFTITEWKRDRAYRKTSTIVFTDHWFKKGNVVSILDSDKIAINVNPYMEHSYGQTRPLKVFMFEEGPCLPRQNHGKLVRRMRVVKNFAERFQRKFTIFIDAQGKLIVWPKLKFRHLLKQNSSSFSVKIYTQ